MTSAERAPVSTNPLHVSQQPRHMHQPPPNMPPPNKLFRTISLAPPRHSWQPEAFSRGPDSPSLYPPFYGRPPTPLPRTPSLTSLLRPTSTPDPSDRPPVSSLPPPIPTHEYYGFLIYVLSILSAGLYIAWALIPGVLEGMGINYYPSRWWAVVVPCWLVVGVVYIFVALASINTGVLTKPLGALEAVVDAAGMVAVVKGSADVEERWKGRGRWKEVWCRGTDAVLDVPLGGVCEVLYGEGRERDEDEDEGEVRDGEVVY